MAARQLVVLVQQQPAVPKQRARRVQQMPPQQRQLLQLQKQRAQPAQAPACSGRVVPVRAWTWVALQGLQLRLQR